jgi:hypothetical protein
MQAEVGKRTFLKVRNSQILGSFDHPKSATFLGMPVRKFAVN